jgi:hypothetical protein
MVKLTGPSAQRDAYQIHCPSLIEFENDTIFLQDQEIEETNTVPCMMHVSKKHNHENQSRTKPIHQQQMQTKTGDIDFLGVAATQNKLSEDSATMCSKPSTTEYPERGSIL